MRLMLLTRFFTVAFGIVLLAQCSGAPETFDPITPAIRTDWPMYRGDLAGTGYSPLAEITPANVSNLTRHWTYSLQPEPTATEADDRAGSRGANSQVTPIVVNNVMYLPAADRVVGGTATTTSPSGTLSHRAAPRRGLFRGLGSSSCSAVPLARFQCQ